MANKINESRESLNSLVEGQRKQQEQSPSQVVAAVSHLIIIIMLEKFIHHVM